MIVMSVNDDMDVAKQDVSTWIEKNTQTCSMRRAVSNTLINKC